MLTVYGIETMEIAEDVFSENGVGLQQCLPFTVLKQFKCKTRYIRSFKVATVLTVYGIETLLVPRFEYGRHHTLQQCLPFTVLKLQEVFPESITDSLLQQCLPFTVLKLKAINTLLDYLCSCNSAYRLRY